MQIIPVIDLKDGLVVHAVRGDRTNYRPIHLNSILTNSSDIKNVIAGFLKLYPFEIFYIADLNAIAGSDVHDSLVQNLLAEYPHKVFWLDRGSQVADLSKPHAENQITVIGTESQLAPPEINDAMNKKNFILSLDYKNQQACGHPTWFESAGLWPKQVIVMTLNLVGSDSGPDFKKLGKFSSAHPQIDFVAAGGIRDGEDLNWLSAMDISMALVATALHRGALNGNDIVNLQTKKYPGKPGYF